MDNFDAVALLQRVDRLERQNKLMKLVGCAVVLGIILILFCGAQSSNKVINAQQFNLVDINGKVRATLQLKSEGPGLFLFDESGQIRASFENLEGPGLFLYDLHRVRAELRLMWKTGTPALGLYDENGGVLFPK